ETQYIEYVKRISGGGRVCCNWRSDRHKTRASPVRDANWIKKASEQAFWDDAATNMLMSENKKQVILIPVSIA
ncbi:MAG: hypothetical protein WB217_05345, partial [Mesobacillus sp.]|uniref:hypothetical protein n=1 Tax=Mesobacillus sp. TaxID=2675271 RepID=UPI003C378BA6